MNDSELNQAIKSKLEDPNWSKYMTQRVLESQVANTKGNNQSRSDSGFWNSSILSPSVKRWAAAILVIGLGVGIYQIGNKESNPDKSEIGMRGTEIESSYNELASVDLTMEGDLFWENDEWDEEFELLTQNGL